MVIFNSYVKLPVEYMIGEIAENTAYTQCFPVIQSFQSLGFRF